MMPTLEEQIDDTLSDIAEHQLNLRIAQAQLQTLRNKQWNLEPGKTVVRSKTRALGPLRVVEVIHNHKGRPWVGAVPVKMDGKWDRCIRLYKD